MPTSDLQTIEVLRQRHVEAFERLRQARKEGDKIEARNWEKAFKRISALRDEAGDDLNAPIFSGGYPDVRPES